MQGFYASIVLAFISEVELFDYVLDGGDLQEPGCGGKPTGGCGLDAGGNQTVRTS